MNPKERRSGMTKILYGRFRFFPMHKLFLVTLIALLFSAEMAFATPSTTYWTPATTDIQPFGVVHIGVDNYFTVNRKANDGSGALGTDSGLTVGVLPFEKLQMEIGIDYIEPTDYPVSFNAKIGTPESALFTGSPALNLGIFNVGTEKGVNNQNIVYGVIGKTFPVVGGLYGALYIGNGEVLVNKYGNKANTGFMVGMSTPILRSKTSEGEEYNKLVFAADYASGDNSIGGGGFGLYYYFTKDISLLTGPVWFNSEAINGKWKWTIQLDINLPSVTQWFKK